MFRLTLTMAAGVCLLARANAGAQGVFADDERAKIIAYWNAPGRYSVSAPPESATAGPWQVRLTTDASVWLLAYQRAIGAGKAPPTVDAAATSSDTRAWEAWVQAKVDFDRWEAQRAADSANSELIGRAYVPQAAAIAPPPPGPIPPGLLSAAGNPPPFAAAVTPLQYTIAFEDEGNSLYRYQDHVTMRPRYAYYRFSKGTVAYGTPLREMQAAELDALFEAAGFNPTERKVMGAVSRLEGGFDAVNTYDTGYISVGFIQFITHQDGRHSLIEVLQREKAEDPAAFAADFRRFGIDVHPDGVIVAVDPGTGAELIGPPAVLKMVEDKRFAAVFQRAGRRSRAFRLAQVKVAKSHYWPGDDPIRIKVGDRTLEGKVTDVVRSEAGLATLFDRKVNRGNVEPLTEVVAKIMADRGLTAFEQLVDHEREIIQALKYRTDFLADRSLTQPK